MDKWVGWSDALLSLARGPSKIGWISTLKGQV